MKIKFRYQEKLYSIRVEKKDEHYIVTINKNIYKISNVSQQASLISFKLHDKFIHVYFVQDRDKKYLAFDGCYFVLEPERDKNLIATGAVQKGNSVASPMPGLLVKIPVSIGDKVQAGTTLAIVEAMKMQNELRAPCDGIVSKINFEEGAQIDALKPIVELET